MVTDQPTITGYLLISFKGKFLFNIVIRIYLYMLSCYVYDLKKDSPKNSVGLIISLFLRKIYSIFQNWIKKKDGKTQENYWVFKKLKNIEKKNLKGSFFIQEDAIFDICLVGLISYDFTLLGSLSVLISEQVEFTQLRIGSVEGRGTELMISRGVISHVMSAQIMALVFGICIWNFHQAKQNYSRLGK